MKATTLAEKRQHKTPKVDPSISQSAQIAAKGAQMAAKEKETQPTTQPPAPVTPETTQPVTPAQTEPPKPKEEKPKAPSISATVRKLVWQNQKATVEELTNLLIKSGWDEADAKKRGSTLSTLRTDALAIIQIGRDLGLLKE